MSYSKDRWELGNNISQRKGQYNYSDYTYRLQKKLRKY